MTLDLDSIIADIKRKTQYGNPSSATDQAAQDILNSIDDNISDIVMDWQWDWLYKAVEITLSPGVTDYTLDSDIAKLLGMGTGDGSPFNIISFKDYFEYYAPDSSLSETTEGSVFWGMYIGRDTTTGARILRIGNIPSSTSTIDGFGQIKMDALSVSDLGTAKSLLPFPPEGISTLKAYCVADVYALQGKKDLIFPQQASALRKLKAWRGSQMSDSIQDVKSGVPPYLRRKIVNRRNGYVV